MWRYLRRQWGCKTGKYCMGIIAGVIANKVFNDPNTVNTIGQVANALLPPEMALIAKGYMFLRDKEAKKEEEAKL